MSKELKLKDGALGSKMVSYFAANGLPTPIHADVRSFIGKNSVKYLMTFEDSTTALYQFNFDNKSLDILSVEKVEI